jgi:hypothetical protein
METFLSDWMDARTLVFVGTIVQGRLSQILSSSAATVTAEDLCAMDVYGLIALGLDLGSLFLLSQCLARDNKRWDENPEGERPLVRIYAIARLPS